MEQSFRSELATRRRVYSKEDMERLRMLRQLTLMGHPISSVANLSLDELDARLESQSGHLAAASQPADAVDAPIIRDCIQAVETYELETFNHCSNGRPSSRDTMRFCAMSSHRLHIALAFSGRMGF